ncbi:MAG: cysteine desulfurase NifS [Candidatus Delongbacteria bacterium]|nr:cysteine desulfurase NifS [Candidatus Delongbacteria bacterium]
MATIYFDNNATTAVAPEVAEAMRPFLGPRYGNASSIHQFGGAVRRDIEKARQSVAELVGADPQEILFTSCGTESDNTAFWSALESGLERRRIITSQVEHPAVLNVAQFYEKKGYPVTYIGVDKHGNLDMEYFHRSLSDDTLLVSLMLANNETGVIFPIRELADLCRSRGVLFHTDAVQAAGKIPLNLHRLGVDYAAFSGHKFHAPKGIGIMYIRKGAPFVPFMIGGHQEYGRRGGTEAVPYIVAIGKAAELAMLHLHEEELTVTRLRDHLETRILDEIPKSFLNGDGALRMGNTTNISFEGIEGESILLLLDEQGICASSGSACTTGSLEPSHVLRAMQVPYQIIHGSLRLSLSCYNTLDEVNFTVDRLKEIVAHLRSISPFWKD